mmetsp:Transcript_102592/g.299297  ORF Transcript_102592/g.299297 Transcript_102592/m.299297 type:complete len:221 (+) Transcript_102592:361-1023(+)
MAELLVARRVINLDHTVGKGSDDAVLVGKETHHACRRLNVAHGLHGIQLQAADAPPGADPEAVGQLEVQLEDLAQRALDRGRAAEAAGARVVLPGADGSVVRAREEDGLVHKHRRHRLTMADKRGVGKGLLTEGADLATEEAAEEPLGLRVEEQGGHGRGQLHLVVLREGQGALSSPLAGPDHESAILAPSADAVAHNGRGVDAVKVPLVLRHPPDLRKL